MAQAVEAGTIGVGDRSGGPTDVSATGRHGIKLQQGEIGSVVAGKQGRARGGTANDIPGIRTGGRAAGGVEIPVCFETRRLG